MAHRLAPSNVKLFKPTDEQRRQVLMMTGFGIIQDDIAVSLQISKPTLHKHFRRELDTGMIEANVRVAKALYENATRHNNTTAQIWWTKARMGWKSTDAADSPGNQQFVIITGVPRELNAPSPFTTITGVARQLDQD